MLAIRQLLVVAERLKATKQRVVLADRLHIVPLHSRETHKIICIAHCTTGPFKIVPISFVYQAQYGPRYNWTRSDQSLLLGAYFWGYLFTCLPGGLLADRFGGRQVVGWSMAFSAVLTAAMPIGASLSLWAVMVLRFLIGVAGVSKMRPTFLA